MRIGPDRAFVAWQRLAVTGLAGLVLVLTNSRTGFVFAVSAALLHAVLVIRRRSDLPDYRGRWLAVATPFAVLALVLVFSGGGGFLLRNRFGGDSDVTSGRADTWKQVVTDWRHAGWAEKAFGDATTSRAVVIRSNDGAPPDGPRRKLNTDNAAVGAFRRGGVLGALAFLAGVVLLLRHALRARSDGTPPPAWFTIAALGVIPTIATEDWLLGGTNGAIWILLLAGEARSPYGFVPPGPLARVDDQVLLGGAEPAQRVQVEARHGDQADGRADGQSPHRADQVVRLGTNRQTGQAN
jgi:O-antigen ligase